MRTRRVATSEKGQTDDNRVKNRQFEITKNARKQRKEKEDEIKERTSNLRTRRLGISDNGQEDEKKKKLIIVDHEE